jgi:hypothetical protein
MAPLLVRDEGEILEGGGIQVRFGVEQNCWPSSAHPQDRVRPPHSMGIECPRQSHMPHNTAKRSSTEQQRPSDTPSGTSAGGRLVLSSGERRKPPSSDTPVPRAGVQLNRGSRRWFTRALAARERWPRQVRYLAASQPQRRLTERIPRRGSTRRRHTHTGAGGRGTWTQSA